MQKNIFTIILLVVSFFVASKIQSFVINNTPDPVVVPQDETSEIIDSLSSASTTDQSF